MVSLVLKYTILIFSGLNLLILFKSIVLRQHKLLLKHLGCYRWIGSLLENTKMFVTKFTYGEIRQSRVYFKIYNENSHVKKREEFKKKNPSVT